MTESMADSSSKATPKMRRQPKQARSLERVSRILDVAEELFIEQGYASTTTKAIAKEAKVPIGSLYQFFPDKAAILQALAERYVDLMSQGLEAFGTLDMTQLPLSDYVDRFIDGIASFFAEYPGYHAIFMEVQAILPELDEAADTQLIQILTALLPKYNASLAAEDYEAIAFIMIKAIGNLLWLSLGQTQHFRPRLVIETKRLMLNYLQSYFPAVPSTGSVPNP